MPAGHTAIPPNFHLGFNETPLKNLVEEKRTYELEGVHTVFLSCNRENRMVTEGPATNEEGYVCVFQISWKGKFAQCHPHSTDKMKDPMHPAIFHDHTAKKTHNTCYP